MNGAIHNAYELEDLTLWRFQLIKNPWIHTLNSVQFNQNSKWIVFGWLVVRLTTDPKIYMEVQRSKRSQNTLKGEEEVERVAFTMPLLIIRL